MFNYEIYIIKTACSLKNIPDFCQTKPTEISQTHCDCKLAGNFTQRNSNGSPAQISCKQTCFVLPACSCPNLSDLANLKQCKKQLKKRKVFLDDVWINASFKSSQTKPSNTLNSGLNEINFFLDKLLNSYFTVDIPYEGSQQYFCHYFADVTARSFSYAYKSRQINLEEFNAYIL